MVAVCAVAVHSCRAVADYFALARDLCALLVELLLKSLRYKKHHKSVEKSARSPRDNLHRKFHSFTTGWIYTDGEINATEDNDYGYAGTLYGTQTKHKAYDNAQLAADGIGANQVDCVIIDELPAQFIVSKNADLKCVPLYYAGATDAEDAPVEEQYAICVTKGNTELLNAINAVLEEMMKNGDVEKLVMQHMGFDK